MTETFARYSKVRVGIVLLPFSAVVIYALYGLVRHYAAVQQVQSLTGVKGAVFAVILVAGALYLSWSFVPILTRTYVSRRGALYEHGGELKFVWGRPRSVPIDHIRSVRLDVHKTGFRTYRDLVFELADGGTARVRTNLFREKPESILQDLTRRLALAAQPQG